MQELSITLVTQGAITVLTQGANAEDFCEQVQNLRLSDLQIEECSNMGTEMGSLESSPRG